MSAFFHILWFRISIISYDIKSHLESENIVNNKIILILFFLSCKHNCEIMIWLILILMITKQDLELMIIFQVWLGKTIFKVAITKINHVNEKSWRRKPPQKRRVFQDLNFIRSLCKVVGALRLSCISLFIYAQKSSKSNIVLNILRIGWFHVFN